MPGFMPRVFSSPKACHRGCVWLSMPGILGRKMPVGALVGAFAGGGRTGFRNAVVRHTSRYVPRKWRNETFADVGARLPCFIEDARFIENARLRFCAGRSTVSHCAVLTPRIRLLSLFKRGSWGEISSNSSRTSGLNAQSLNGKLGAPTSAMYVLHLNCWRTRSISRHRSMLASHRQLYRVTASHGHLVLLHTGDGD